MVTTIIKAHDFDNQKSWSQCEDESRDWLKRNFKEDEVNGAEDAHQLGRLSSLESGRFFEDEEGELKAKKSAQAETEKQKAAEIIPFEI